MDSTLIKSAFSAIVIMIVVGCANKSHLTGKWLLITDNNSYQVLIEQLDDNTFYIKSQGLKEISGKYRLEKKILKLVSPEHPRVNGIVLEQTTDNSWIIINTPISSRMPTPFVGAKLVR